MCMPVTKKGTQTERGGKASGLERWYRRGRGLATNLTRLAFGITRLEGADGYSREILDAPRAFVSRTLVVGIPL